MYAIAVISTLAAWIAGLLLDANIEFGDPAGFLSFRIILPVLVMGVCILKSIKDHDNKK